MTAAVLTAAAIEAMLARLLRAKDHDIAAIVGEMPERHRAELAVFCYSRAHLHQIGFAIAAVCELQALIQASPSNAAGHLLYEQSRARPKQEERSTGGTRSRITLAKSASGNSALASIIASIASDELAAEPA